MARSSTLTSLNELLEEKLRTFRPRGRYSPGEREWQERAVDAVLHKVVDDQEVIKALVMAQAVSMEGSATKSANNILRKAAKERQMPLDWFDAADAPIAFEITQIIDDEISQVKQRVRLGDATGEDFRAWAATERRRLDRDVQQREAAIEGGEFFAEFLAEVGHKTLLDYQAYLSERSA